MPNEFVARNGVIALNNSVITGSLNVTSGITGSLFGTASWASNATTASYVLNAVSASFATTASYVLNAVSASFASTASFIPTSSLTNNFFVQGGNSFGAQAVLGTNDVQNLALETNGSTRMFISSGGNVGIGTTSSLANFQVGNSSALANYQGGLVGMILPTGSGTWIELADNSTNGTAFRISKDSGAGIIFNTNGREIGFKADSYSTTMTDAQLILKTSGNVGIGKTTPAAKLDVSGSVIISGNVGIANTSPLNKLHITQGTDTAYPTLGTGKGGLFIAGDNNLYGLYVGINTSDGNSYMQVMRNNTATAYNLILQPVGGNVGIGKTSPNATLDVSGSTIITGSLNVTAGITGSLFGTSSFATSASFASTASFIPTSSLTGNFFVQGGNSFSAQAVLGTNDVQDLAFETSGSVRMTISGSNGNIGIGTTSSAKKLHVKGGNDDVLLLDNGGQQYTSQYFANNGTTKAFLAWDNTNSLYSIGSAVSSDFNFYTSNIERMRITSGGNVGIGKTTPTAKLDISGSTIITGSLNVLGSITTTGTLTAQTLVVQTITSSTDFVTGSTRFGSLLANTHQFTGSVSMTGSLTTVGTASFNGNVGIGTTSPTVKLDVDGGLMLRGGGDILGGLPATDYGNLTLRGGYAFNTSSVSKIEIRGYEDGAATQQAIISYTAGVERMRINSAGNLLVGTSTNDVSALLNVSSSTKGFLPPRMTTTQRNAIGSPATGLSIYNTTLNTNDTYDGTQWQRFGASTSITGTATISTSLTNPLLIGGTTTTSTITYQPTSGVGTTGADHIFKVGNNGATEAMRILNNANVGIGTTPTGVNGKLQVSGSIGLSGNSEIRQNTNSDGSTLKILATQVVGASTNSAGYGYSGGGIIASVSAADSTLLLDAGYTTSTFGRFKIANTTSSNTSLSLEKNGVYTLFASTIGNVGIGTATPNAKLDISGSLNISGSGVQVPLQVSSGSTSLLFVSQSGNVGIGTTSPASKLTVFSANGTTYASTAQLRVDGGGVNNNYAQIIFSDSALSDGKISYYPAAAAADRFFSISARTTESDFVIRGDGKVGIGTSSPSDILDVQKNQNGTTQFYFRNTDTTNASSRAYLNVVAGTNRISLYSLNADNNYFNTAYGNLHFQMNASTSVITPMFISSSGNVGIGTTSPAYKLDVSGSVGATSFNNNGASSSDLLINNSNNGGIIYQADNNGHKFQTYSGSWLDRLTILDGGNVGIGTTSPAYKLDVSGSVKVQNGLVAPLLFNRITTTYTLVLTDQGKMIEANFSSNSVITVPQNANVAFPIGTEISVVMRNTGTVQIVGETGIVGVAVYSAGSLDTISTQYGAASLVKVDTNEWYLYGNLT